MNWLIIDCANTSTARFKHWKVIVRPANAFCMPYITQSHKYVVLATHSLASHTPLKCRSVCNH